VNDRHVMQPSILHHSTLHTAPESHYSLDSGDSWRQIVMGRGLTSMTVKLQVSSLDEVGNVEVVVVVVE